MKHVPKAESPGKTVLACDFNFDFAATLYPQRVEERVERKECTLLCFGFGALVL